MARKRKAEAISDEAQRWLGCIAAYDRAFKKWESRNDKIIKRYRDEIRDGSRSDTSKFNILWSNVQTLSAATYSRLPKPDVSRRFRDNDPTGRVASLILERALEFEIQHYEDYRATMRSSVLDRFLGGRATAWARYEPHFRALEVGEPPEGVEVTEDADEGAERLDYECAPVDYVHWKDFGHTVARTWEEVTAVWRRVYMTREALVERFGKEGEKVPLDATPEDLKRSDKGSGDADMERGVIIEIWDKPTKRALWLSKSLGKIIDEKPDPLGLSDFWPCPHQLFATMTNETLVPLPDFTLYQDQANELDLLSDRIDGLVRSLKVMGVYDGSITELKRLFTEGDNTAMFPVKNWAAYAEKGKLTGAIDLVDLKPIYEALKNCYLAMEQVKGQIYEITGISDIVRGETNPNETLGAQELKGQYANLRLKSYQEQVAIYATQLLQIKAQVMCNKFAPETLQKISAVEQLSASDKALVPAAMQLLLGERAENPEAPPVNPMRAFRIEVAADSLVYLDENQEKESRVEFLTATGGYLKQVADSLQNVPPPVAAVMVPLLMEMLKFGVTGFRVGKSIEGAFDEAAEKLKQIASQPQQAPQIPPEQIEQMRAQIEQELKGKVTLDNAQKDIGLNKRAADLDIREMKFGAEQEVKKVRDVAEASERLTAHKCLDDNAVLTVKGLLAQHEVKIDGVLQKAAAAHKEATQEGEEAKAAVSEDKGKQAVADALTHIAEMNRETTQAIGEVLKVLAAPKRLVRDSNGRAMGMEPVL